MSTDPDPNSEPNRPRGRAEKLSLLTAMLGPDAMERIRKRQPDLAGAIADNADAVDPDRAAWHRNKLLERLRAHADLKKQPAQQLRNGTQSHMKTPETSEALRAEALDKRISGLASQSPLQNEHPAVIARVLSGMSRLERVETLKTLPGPMARSIIRRLR
ncbi:hypothetical protein V8J82_07100 [Gymnodinialimonas sp. 2305UL16-5]|uniref:hypothetical protein n=1 Tax=Gymnodinialimonas mytili TaxID=3126503 RepID=UPI0030A6ADFA